MKARHVVLLGLDGVPPEAFPSLFDQGLMPYTKHLWGRLWTSPMAVDLPFTLASWTAISTGVNPGKHGVFDFVEPGPGGLRVVTRERLERPTINEMVAVNGLETVTINVPMTYPPSTRSRCVVVADWTSPYRGRAWPPEEEERVSRLMPSEPLKAYTLEGYLEALARSMEHRLELIEYYYTRRRWSLFYTVIPETDWAFHRVYGDLVVRGRAGRPLRRLFSLIDRAVRLVYENMPDDTLFIAVSDHGFMEASRSLNGNVLLAREGLLRVKTASLNLRSRLILSAARLLPARVRHRLKYRLQAFFEAIGAADAFRVARIPVDYESSKAYMTISYNVYVNPRLTGDERREVRMRVYRLFSRYSDMLKTVAFREEYFHGPYVERAPDIVVVPARGCNVSTRLASRSIVEEGRWYVHSDTAFIAMNAEPGAAAQPRSWDVAPTVLAALGLPIDPEFDGRPLTGEPGGARRYGFIARLGRLRRRLAGRGAGRG